MVKWPWQREKRTDSDTRTDAITRIIASISDSKLDQFDYMPYLHRYKVTKVDVKEDLEAMALRNSVAWRIIHLSDHVFAHGFSFVDEKDQERAEFAPVLKDLEQLDWRRKFSLLWQYERTHGWAALLIVREGESYTNMKAPASSEEAIADIHPINPVLVQKVDLDRKTGKPEMMHVKFVQEVEGDAKPMQTTGIHASHCIWVNTRPVDLSYKGVSILKPCWPQLVYYTRIISAMATQAAKLAGGVLMVPLAQGAENERDTIKTQIKGLNYLRGLIYPETTLGAKPSWEAPPVGQTPFTAYIDTLLNDISIVSELPKTYLTGTEAGAVTGSVINSRQVFAAIRKEQQNSESIILELIGLMHPKLENELTGAKFNWRILYSLGRLEEAELESTLADAFQKQLAHKTVNEVRKDLNLPPLDVEGANVPLSLQQIQLAFQRPKQEETSSKTSPKPRPASAPSPSPKMDRLSVLLRHYRCDGWPMLRQRAHQLAHQSTGKTGVDEACRAIGISTATYYSWSEKYD